MKHRQSKREGISTFPASFYFFSQLVWCVPVVRRSVPLPFLPAARRPLFPFPLRRRHLFAVVRAATRSRAWRQLCSYFVALLGRQGRGTCIAALQRCRFPLRANRHLQTAQFLPQMQLIVFPLSPRVEKHACCRSSNFILFSHNSHVAFVCHRLKLRAPKECSDVPGRHPLAEQKERYFFSFSALQLLLWYHTSKGGIALQFICAVAQIKPLDFVCHLGAARGQKGVFVDGNTIRFITESFQ